MKHSIIRQLHIITLILIAILLSSCGQESRFYVAIPEDAHAVLKLDYKKLTKDLNDKSKETLSTELNFLEGRAFNQDEPILVVLKDDEVLVFLALNDKDDFVKALKLKYDLKTIVNSEDGEIYSIKEDVFVSFSEHAAGFYFNIDENADLFLLQECLREEKNDVPSKYITTINSSDQINMWFDAEEILEEVTEEGLLSNSIIKDACVLSSLNFKKAELELKSRLEGAETITYALDKFIKPASNKYLKYVPKNSVIVVNIGLKNLGMLAMMWPELKKEITKEYEFLYDIIAKVNGTITLAISESVFEDRTKPEFVMIVQSDKDSYTALTQELYKLGAPIEKFSSYFIIDNELYLLYQDDAIILMSEDYYSKKGHTAALSLSQDRLDRIAKGGILLDAHLGTYLLEKGDLAKLDLEYSSLNFTGSTIDINFILNDKDIHPLDKIIASINW